MTNRTMPSEVRAGLQRRREQYAEQLKRLEYDQQRSAAPLSADFAEQAAETENDEVVDALAHRTRTAIRQIDHALRRDDAGQWDECERCGQPIGEARHGKLPEATRCSACADER